MSTVSFKINGEEHSVGSDISADVMLVDYLRNHLNLRGTKYMCREGGCGTCIVTASKSTGEPSIAINSCLVAVLQCDGWEIITIEGLGNRKKGYHSIQNTLYEQNGSQCGYCSPGWSMAMYGLLNQNKKATMLDIEKSLSSNLCRCTGYRPIIEGFKKFGIDAPSECRIKDIEDLTLCKEANKECNKEDCEEADWCLLKHEDLFENETKKIELKDKKTWYRPTSLNSVLDIFKTIDLCDYMLVGGNTAKGVNPIDDYPSTLIDINAVPELKVVELDQNLIVGAGLPLTDFLNVLKDYGQKVNFEYLQKVHDHVSMIAHIAVRNVGTIAGNLMIKHTTNSFQSDLFLLLETVGAQTTIVDRDYSIQTVTMQEFLLLNMQGKVIVNILIPPLNAQEHHLLSFKIMSRSQSTHAIVNAGFLYKLTNENIVKECRIVYGALSSNFIRASSTEAYLVGKSLFTNETLQGAIQVLEAELVIEERPPEPSALFRRFLAKSLLYKGLLTLAPSSVVSTRNISGAVNLHDARGESSGVQTYPTDNSKYPLNQPIKKLEGLIQCAGEAKYTDDIWSMPNEVFAAFVLSTVAIGTIEEINASEAMKIEGVVAFYTAKDIPGLNSFTPADDIADSDNEEVLADGTVKFYHQPIAIIVAVTQHIAEKASKLVKVTYSNNKTPVLDIKEARNDSSRNTLVASVDSTSTGTDISKTITGTHTLYGQYHMTMETNVCVAMPTEEGIEVHTAAQWMGATHTMISRALNIDQNKISVYVNRIGGGFGMKVSRNTQFAVACSLVVVKLNRPCRFSAPLTVNTKALGKRMPCVNDYTVAVNSTGVIQYINTNIYEDNGYKINEKLSALGYDVYANCYDVTKFNYKLFDTITDSAKTTWCRAPGTLETLACIELTMDRIAYETRLDPIEVRLANLDRTEHSIIEEMLDTLKTKADYVKRREDIELYNRENRWKKKGLRMNFCRWAPNGYLRYDVNLSIYHTDGTIVLTHSGVEMGQGLNTKAAQMVAYFLGVSIDKVQVKGNNSIGSPNAYISGGSLGHQTVLIGVKKCCNEINNRFDPIRAMNQNLAWEALVRAAYDNDVDLQAHGYAGAADAVTYNVYGIGCCEVEVDLLTGELEIHRFDILQDVGFSLNPEIDIGQIEGGLIMGIGYFTSEKILYDTTGELFTTRTWDIHVPVARDIPKELKVHILPNSYGEDVILGSKATGEPAICSSVVVALALREAITQGRLETGIPTTTWFDIDGPYSNEMICLSAATVTDDFKFN